LKQLKIIFASCVKNVDKTFMAGRNEAEMQFFKKKLIDHMLFGSINGC
jgi:hypothetical protein